MEELLEQNGNVSLPESTPILDAEWCFQFFDNEPIVFAWSTEGTVASPMVLNINSVEGDGLTFRQNGMSFRIFPREITENTKNLRTEEKLKQKNASKD